jgi:hypothetical protein
VRAKRAAPQGAQSRRTPLTVELDMPKAVPVGAVLPVKVRVRTRGPVGKPAAQTHLFFQIFSRDGKTPVRFRERKTNTLGTAHMHMTALELPGFYKLNVYASKGRHRGLGTRIFKVRRR